MIIQENMPVNGILLAWPSTRGVFKKYGICCNTNKNLNLVVPKDRIEKIMDELNNTIGRSISSLN
ncbi:hypothetical protein [Bacillus massilinigeriensis]|uniref:hypothetical protein n=1 Tax=Bacillus massilionigeriensis TaxID=1805475 RepID=UPI00096B2138|nr:hypothetical protein [Bacillus massilionigeriensis]